MNRRYAPVHAETAIGWDIVPDPGFRGVITGSDGSSSLAWHTVVPPGGVLPAYSLANCDEFRVLVTGQGVASQDGERAVLRTGHCWLCPSGAERYFQNGSSTEPATLVGFWPGAADLETAGYEAAESPREHFAPPVARFRRGILVHADDVAPETMDAGEGWSISDFRLPLGRDNGCASTLFRAQFLPGAVHRKHRHDHCEEIYYVIGGSGIAGVGGRRSAVHGGHFHYIPAGVEHWLVNGGGEPVEVVGIYIGAGSVAETGYVYSGDVTAEDLG